MVVIFLLADGTKRNAAHLAGVPPGDRDRAEHDAAVHQPSDSAERRHQSDSRDSAEGGYTGRSVTA